MTNQMEERKLMKKVFVIITLFIGIIAVVTTLSFAVARIGLWYLDNESNIVDNNPNRLCLR